MYRLRASGTLLAPPSSTIFVSSPLYYLTRKLLLVLARFRLSIVKGSASYHTAAAIRIVLLLRFIMAAVLFEAAVALASPFLFHPLSTS